jgi:hypothetical protein
MDGDKVRPAPSRRQDNVMDLELAGKHCFVTGASAGIGRAAAVARAADDADENHAR